METGYLTTADINNGNALATIKGLCMIFETTPGENSKTQIACIFNEYKNPLILNKTNLQTLFEICGTRDLKKIKGHVVELQTHTRKTAGRVFSYIRIASLDGVITEPEPTARRLLN